MDYSGYGLGDGESVGGEDLEFGGGAEKNCHAFETLFIESVVDVCGEVCADSGFGDGEASRPLGCQGIDVLKAVDAGFVEVFGD
jgi:hypothetical protein